MDTREASLQAHRQWRGKLSVIAKPRLETIEDLSIAYTPGVAAPCLEIQKDPEKSFELTGRWNTVAVITDGTAVLGLGDIGPEAGMPVMEGKCMLLKAFAGIDAIPLCIRSKDVDEIVRTVSLLAGSFGGINLEDISAPRCFEIESRLRAICDIPISHDDQYGTAITATAGLTNALKVVGKRLEDARVVVSGAGAAGTAIARFLANSGAGDVISCDRMGIISRSRTDLNPAKAALAAETNKTGMTGTLADALVGADAFLGFSGPRLVTGDMIRSMAKDPIVFACANPVPEITPDEAKQSGAAVVATGRSDLPNQLNNALTFPGLFRGALDVRAREINLAMMRAASQALVDFVPSGELSANNILPKVLDRRVAPAVAAAVAQAARDSGVARI